MLSCPWVVRVAQCWGRHAAVLSMVGCEPGGKVLCCFRRDASLRLEGAESYSSSCTRDCCGKAGIAVEHTWKDRGNMQMRPCCLQALPVLYCCTYSCPRNVSDSDPGTRAASVTSAAFCTACLRDCTQAVPAVAAQLLLLLMLLLCKQDVVKQVLLLGPLLQELAAVKGRVLRLSLVGNVVLVWGRGLSMLWLLLLFCGACAACVGAIGGAQPSALSGCIAGLPMGCRARSCVIKTMRVSKVGLTCKNRVHVETK